MNKKNTNKKSKITQAKISARLDEDIDYSKIAEEGEDFFKNARMVDFRTQELVTLPIDRAAFKWYEKHGGDYWKLMSAVLEDHVKGHKIARKQRSMKTSTGKRVA